MYGPTGIGVLLGKRELLEAIPPLTTGGGMVDWVEEQQSSFAGAPSKFEAGPMHHLFAFACDITKLRRVTPGTPPIAQAVGFAAACKFVLSVGFEHIQVRGSKEEGVCCSLEIA